nr:PREDICTED: dynein heavy chain 17, axonemal-like [Haliaeetus albicilla]
MRTVQSEKANLMILFDKYLPVCLEKLKSGFKKITPVPEVTVIQTVLYLLDCLLMPQTTPPDSPRGGSSTSSTSSLLASGPLEGPCSRTSLWITAWSSASGG